MISSTVPHQTARLLKQAAYASIATALLLVAVKFGAWMITGALSILASLLDSLMDVMASLINSMAIRYSLHPADEDHSFGHGKAEALAGLGQSSFIAGSALILLMNGIERLKSPIPLQSVNAGLGIMLFSIVATMILLSFQRFVVKKTNSPAIRADSLHYATDLLTNLCAIAALLLSRMSWGQKIDPLFSMVIAAIILYSAWQIGRESIQLLMDQQLPLDQREKIHTIVISHPQVIGLHDLRTRQSGQVSIIQLHLDLDATLPLAQAHRITKEVEAAIKERFPTADIIIHQDPVSPIVDPIVETNYH